MPSRESSVKSIVKLLEFNSIILLNNPLQNITATCFLLMNWIPISFSDCLNPKGHDPNLAHHTGVSSGMCPCEFCAESRSVWRHGSRLSDGMTFPTHSSSQLPALVFVSLSQWWDACPDSQAAYCTCHLGPVPWAALLCHCAVSMWLIPAGSS